MTDPTPLRIDVRGPRFSAAITVVVLATAFLADLPWLVAVQVVAFGISAILGLRWSPYGNLFRFVRDRFGLGPPTETEAEAGPRFSQLMGFLFSGAGLALLLAGETTVGWALVLVVLALAALLAVTGLCVGCELHAVGVRLRGRSATSGGKA